MEDDTPYQPLRPGSSRSLRLRGLHTHLIEWGAPALATAERPTLVLLHGWMDAGASFQFVVDALQALGGPPRHIVAPDWRGFGRSAASGADSYWFPDYLGDLDALLDLLGRDARVDLLGHSMGGNVAMIYAGVRPQRIRRLVNLEGFGLPAAQADEAPQRLARWLDDLRQPTPARTYASLDALAHRLQAHNPRLPLAHARWLATQRAQPDEGGRWRLLGDPAHQRVNPVLYRVEEVLAAWRQIEAPLLWVEGTETEVERWWQGRCSRAEFDRRLDVVRDCRRASVPSAGHMLHHDQPQALARLLVEFLE